MTRCTLERDGILDLLPHPSAVIRPVDRQFVRNLYDLRAAIEGMLTERCAESVDDAGAAELRAHLDAFEDACTSADALAVVRAKREFHDSINRHADNPDAVRVLGKDDSWSKPCACASASAPPHRRDRRLSIARSCG